MGRIFFLCLYMVEINKISNNISTWNPNDPCFDWREFGPSFGAFNHQNGGQTGSRYLNIDMLRRLKWSIFVWFETFLFRS